MENNKYYTPTIEEFHVGFELECLEQPIRPGNLGNQPAQLEIVYRKTIYDGAMSPLAIREAIKREPMRFRVKYLDREDIESEGWELDDEGMQEEEQNYWFTRNGYTLWYKLNNNLLTITDGDSRTIFSGTINNKSELKKIMKQLNIK